MSQQKRSKSPSLKGSRRSGGRPFPWWVLVALVMMAGAAGVWLASRGAGPTPSADRLPGPLGGREVAQDVNTMVGQAAPAFTLSTAEGRRHDVRPGQGRSTVLIFHMGIT